MKYKYTKFALIFLATTAAFVLFFDIWNLTANSIFLASGTNGVINQSILDIWSNAILPMSVWVINIFVGIRQYIYGLILTTFSVIYYIPGAIIGLWMNLHNILLTNISFKFLSIPNLFLNSAIFLLFIINISCLISWYIESKKS